MTIGVASRIAATFARTKTEGRPALIAYLIPGFPTIEGAPEVFDAVVAGGADMIEVGLPFSDPLADGATHQRAAFQAITNGMDTKGCLEFAAAARKRHPDVPIIFMGYLNLFLAHGIERFAADAAAAGADAAIIVDLPPEEADSTRDLLARHGLALICLVAPTSSDERLALIGAYGGGFVYCVSVAGVTGARAGLPPDLAGFLERVRRCTNLPLAVGFGISRRDHIETLTGIAEGVVVGSAITDLVGRSPAAERAKAVREYLEVLSGRRQPVS